MTLSPGKQASLSMAPHSSTLPPTQTPTVLPSPLILFTLLSLSPFRSSFLSSPHYYTTVLWGPLATVWLPSNASSLKVCHHSKTHFPV